MVYIPNIIYQIPSYTKYHNIGDITYMISEYPLVN